MEEKNEIDVCDDIMLPGFRFHPTDEELVDFYLKKKIQQETLPIDMIKQVDIYKYDPWDLPKMASSGSEKDLYFYCQRDRKYRNSTRPNRVTKAGFWKATGTDRPIYSSKGNCIGLKKSLVFYRGRAAKGIKTEWMMHEFRLPSLSDSSLPRNLPLKALPPSEAWAVCRIFKKAISNKPPSYIHPSFPQFPESLPAGGGSTVSGNISGEYFSSSDGFCYKPMSINEATGTMVLNSECEGLEGVNQQFSHDMNGAMNRTVEFSFTEPSSSDVWRSTMLWDSSLFN